MMDSTSEIATIAAKWEAKRAARTPEQVAADAATEQAAEAERKTRQAREDRALSRANLLSAGVPPRVFDAILDSTLEESFAVKAVAAYLEGSAWSQFLVLCGLPGTGKTFAAYTALQAGGRILRATEIARASLYPSKDGNVLTVDGIKAIRGTLVIDDLGTEPINSSVFEEVVDHRYTHGGGFGTIVTSNLTARALRERYGERIMQRFQHLGTVVEIPAKAKNYRNV